MDRDDGLIGIVVSIICFMHGNSLSCVVASMTANGSSRGSFAMSTACEAQLSPCGVGTLIMLETAGLFERSVLFRSELFSRS